MRLIKENVERITDDKKFIEELKRQGYVEVKDNAGKPKGKSDRKVKKADSK